MVDKILIYELLLEKIDENANFYAEEIPIISFIKLV